MPDSLGLLVELLEEIMAHAVPDDDDATFKRLDKMISEFEQQARAEMEEE